DFSAIEARVVAWLAGEEWVLDVFRRGEGLYEATASQMFGVPIEKVTKDLRTKGKIATLACGYGGGPNALVAMGALKMGLAAHELRTIVDQWRAANARIVAYWRAVESAAISAICGRPRELPHGVRFEASDGALRVRLPAGRELVYIDARVESDPRWEGRQIITYRGADADEDERVGARIKTYGGKLVENITQAVARDCLAETLLRLEVEMPEAPVVLHIHDEVVLEVPDSIAPDDAISRVVEIMRRPMPWAPDLPLDADAFATPYYRADD
ncbi:MAG TPA: DNA polymerase, partial [Planctomycetota bacterium]|nr:DNA polymerase [Planctomycetota bacterium]